MHLHRRAREWYTTTVDTDPALTAWEASFDYGVTYHPGAPVAGSDDEWQWLVAGPEADPTGAVVVGRSVTPEVRAVDNPEILVREAPAIRLVGQPLVDVDPESVSGLAAHLADPRAHEAALDARYATRGRWPVVQIATDGAAPILDTVTYVPGSYTITDTDGGVVHSGALDIRGRGNSTWALPKKPYRLKLGTATALLGMAASQKNWALLANHYDKAKVSNALAFTIGAGMSGLTWTPQYRIVEVVLNGDYLGLYQLADLVRRETGRIPGSAVSGTSGDSITGTWLMEVSRKDRDASVPGFDTTRGAGILWDDPEAPNAQQQAYITGYVQAFEDALFSTSFMDPATGWRAYADESSFADWYLVQELLRNQDSQMWSSCKLWKPRGGKLHMGPLWDFDLSAGIGWNDADTSISANAPATGFYTQLGGGFWFTRLWLDGAFRTTLQQRWPAVVHALGDYATFVDRLIDAETLAVGRDDKRWTTTTYQPYHADYRKRWLAQRVTWLGGQVNAPIDAYSDTYSDTYPGA